MQTGTRTARAACTLGAAMIIAAGVGCAAKAPRATDTAPATMRPATSTSSDATLSQRGPSAQTAQSIEELIASRAPGVQVIRGENGTFALRIRGVSSPSGINDPLIVVDGTVSNAPGTRGLEGINPQDVVRIEVLKDAASTAFYGLRGGSGVILITTRKK